MEILNAGMEFAPARQKVAGIAPAIAGNALRDAEMGSAEAMKIVPPAGMIVVTARMFAEIIYARKMKAVRIVQQIAVHVPRGAGTGDVILLKIAGIARAIVENVRASAVMGNAVLRKTVSCVRQIAEHAQRYVVMAFVMKLRKTAIFALRIAAIVPLTVVTLTVTGMSHACCVHRTADSALRVVEIQVVLHLKEKIAQIVQWIVHVVTEHVRIFSPVFTGVTRKLPV